MLQTVEQSHPKAVHYASPLTPPTSNTGSPSLSSTTIVTGTTTKMSIANHHHILIVTGPAGCGKSTVAKYLAERYGFDYIEGDEVSNRAAS
jgi:gluconokinase